MFLHRTCRFGVIASTPRDGSTPKPFEQDTSIIRDNEIKNGATDVCGKTKAGGNNDVATQLAGMISLSNGISIAECSPLLCVAVASSGLPTAAADGSVSMTLHQVNGDGAGCVLIFISIGVVYTYSTPLLSWPYAVLTPASAPPMVQAPTSSTWRSRPMFPGRTAVLRLRPPISPS